MDTNDRFFLDLRSALNHLYDPEYLTKSPLVALFGLDAHYDRAAALQQCLIKAIEALRPRSNDLLAERDRQAYDLLLYRYVQRLTQEEMAHQFGISERQLRRDQNRAVRLLAGRLWEQYGLMEKPAAPQPPPQLDEGHASRDETLDWLVKNPSECFTAPAQMLVSVIELAQPLAERHAVHLEWTVPADLPPLAVHPIAFRQMVLALLGHTLRSAAGGQCTLWTNAGTTEVTFEITAQWPDDRRLSPPADLEQVEELVELFKGRLTRAIERSRLCYRLDLPACDRWPVLVIDDNADLLQLFQRYVAGTRYQVIPAQESEQAFALLATHTPRMIVLDVMMPRMDGWEVLRKLRNHPLARHLPIIVCTIINQPELAYALGANAFLRKPVTQTALLETLERLSASPGSGLH